MEGSTVTGGAYLGFGAGQGKVVAWADFNTDGQPDLLWQDSTSGDVSLWTMVGTNRISTSSLARGMGPWKVVATGDFCGNDGKPDVVWQHDTAGDVYLWCMTGTTVTSGIYLTQNMGAWKVVAAADFNKDGQPDLLWQHATSGDVYLWFMTGTTVTSGTYLAQGMTPWQVVAIMDLDEDGYPDLLWQHGTSWPYDVYVWFMTGTTVTNSRYFAQNLGWWKLVGPE